LSYTVSSIPHYRALNVYWTTSNKHAAATVSFIVLISTVLLLTVDSISHIFTVPYHHSSPGTSGTILAVQVTMLRILLMTAVCSAVTSAMHVSLWLDELLFLHDDTHYTTTATSTSSGGGGYGSHGSALLLGNDNSCLYNLTSGGSTAIAGSSQHMAVTIFNVLLVLSRVFIGFACFFLTTTLIIIPVVLLQESCIKYYTSS